MRNSILATTSNVSRETFLPYVDLLLKWNRTINLIGPATEPEIWQRHIEDSLRLVSEIPATAKTIADFGSGAGLPGLVIALARPDLSVTLVEQDQRKAAFLTEAKSRLNLSHVTVANQSIESLVGNYDVITARALAPLTHLLAHAEGKLAPKGICLFLKGAQAEAELAEARRAWACEVSLIPSAVQEKT